MQALDDKRISIDTNHPNTVAPLLISNNGIPYSSNHIVPVPYDNPTFINQSGTIYDDTTIGKTYF